MASSSLLGKEEEAVSTCDMRTIDATNLPAPVLAKMLQTVQEPVLVRGALGELWPLHDQFVERFGGVGVEVTHVGPTGFGWARPVPKNDHRYLLGGQMADARLASLTIAELNTAIANGTATEDTYCFHDVVDEVPLMDALASLAHLNDHLLVQRHAPCQPVAPWKMSSGTQASTSQNASADRPYRQRHGVSTTAPCSTYPTHVKWASTSKKSSTSMIQSTGSEPR